MSKRDKNRNSKKSSSARPDAKGILEGNVILKARLWLEKDDEIFIASGRIQLLKLLDECGSISSAAQKMGISYHHAWNLIDKMNNLSKEPLIITSQGGKGGGGATLSPKAKEIITKFETIQEKFQDFIDSLTSSGSLPED